MLSGGGRLGALAAMSSHLTEEQIDHFREVRGCPPPDGCRFALRTRRGHAISFCWVAAGMFCSFFMTGVDGVVQVFAVFDADGSGSIDVSELGSCLRALGQVRVAPLTGSACWFLRATLSQPAPFHLFVALRLQGG